MITTGEYQDLGAALFGKTRRSILALIYGHPDEDYYLREIARRTQCGLGGVQRELHRLAEAGLVVRRVRGRQVYYQACRRSPIFPELQALMVKTAGVVDVLRAALQSLADRIDAALVYGSFVAGEPTVSSDVDILVVGDVSFGEIVSALRPAQDKLGREINPSVYAAAEVRRRLAAGHHFLHTVLRGPKSFVLGDARELGRLAKKRLARRAQNQQTRDRGFARRRRP